MFARGEFAALDRIVDAWPDAEQRRAFRSHLDSAHADRASRADPPRSAEPFAAYHAACALRNLGRKDDAFALLSRTGDAPPGLRVEVYSLMAVTGPDPVEHALVAERAAQQVPDREPPEHRFALARAYVAAGSAAAELETIRELAARHPDDPVIARRLAWHLVRTGDDAGAAAILKSDSTAGGLLLRGRWAEVPSSSWRDEWPLALPGRPLWFGPPHLAARANLTGAVPSR